jgi:hypothetical protein
LHRFTQTGVDAAGWLHPEHVREGYEVILSALVGTARFLKVDPVAATVAPKHVDQVSAGQQ